MGGLGKQREAIAHRVFGGLGATAEESGDTRISGLAVGNALRAAAGRFGSESEAPRVAHPADLVLAVNEVVEIAVAEAGQVGDGQVVNVCAVHTLTINQRWVTVNNKMTRRALFFLAALSPEKPAPVSEAAWNDFAGRANYYAGQLKLGVIDLKAWAAVLKAWKALR